ncbi:MAG: ATP-binding protein [Elusimicrobia bacterium]|nr:ATP-binding protein [Elusimicrobiota bacterium]
MYSRTLKTPAEKSFFLFGPRGTGKTHWVRSTFPQAVYLDLLESRTYNDLLADPQRLERHVPETRGAHVVIDEIQRVPALLDEVHRLIENRRTRFILTGSSARKLRRGSANLLAGRALTCSMHPLTARELDKDYRLEHSLKWGQLPNAYTDSDPEAFLESYVKTYLREEVLQEGLTRNLSRFTRFLEAASFAQGSVLNLSNVARECAVHRKVVESYFGILEDLLIGVRLPPFAKRAKRRPVSHPKFYYFDVGVYRTLRPKGPLDTPEEIEGVALESLVFQELSALLDNLRLNLDLYYWRAATGIETDFVLYGKDGFIGLEVKRTDKVRDKDLRGLKAFISDYPSAKGYLLYLGSKPMNFGRIQALPAEEALRNLAGLIRPPPA